ncbi:peptidoglycan-binding domain-containing protein [Streptomyces sp. NPDC006638]|uniref:peptidoglycan-binding domain-containing protein n=1 Tax=Streptomyces sp. NPDC006638 TaxID=3157183 RepID=UPI0033BE9D92
MRRVQATAVAAATFVAGVIALVPAGPAAAATPTCNWVASYSGAWVPSLQSGNITCNLVQGTYGEAVRQLQTTLNKCYGARLTVDKSFGPATRSALVAAQRAAGTPADGEYGPNTRAAIRHEPLNGSTNCVRVP